VHCPRCGTENEPGDRFCSNCGATLGRAKTSPEQLPLGERLKRLVGTTRRARLITAGTALAIVVAIVAAFALPSNDSGIPRDSYTIAADRICVNAKKQIGAAGSRALADASRGPSDPGEYARALVPIVAQWRVDFDGLHTPDDRVQQANALNEALLEVETQASSLALAAERSATDLAARAQRVDELTKGVESAIGDLGLDECSGIAIAPGAPAPG
jgi:hypothetical protein